MPIHYSCPSCGRRYVSKDEHAGQIALCRGCQTSIVIPQPSAKGVHGPVAASPSYSGITATPNPAPTETYSQGQFDEASRIQSELEAAKAEIEEKLGRLRAEKAELHERTIQADLAEYQERLRRWAEKAERHEKTTNDDDLEARRQRLIQQWYESGKAIFGEVDPETEQVIRRDVEERVDAFLRRSEREKMKDQSWWQLRGRHSTELTIAQKLVFGFMIVMVGLVLYAAVLWIVTGRFPTTLSIIGGILCVLVYLTVSVIESFHRFKTGKGFDEPDGP